MESFIGIRVPVLRKFAKEFTKEAECKDFLHQLPHEYYDENMLHGLLISEVLKTEDIHPPKTGISVHFSGSLV